MCTIAILLGVADAPLVLAANRDELYARPTRGVEILRAEAPRIIGGVDAISGGTWLAIRQDGRFAAVTNQRALAPRQPLRSRGLAVRELAGADDPDRYVAALDPQSYASMNLVWGDAERVTIAYLRTDGTKELEQLGRGVHVLCNDRLGAPGFPRGERLAAAIAPVVDRPWPVLAAALATALGDHTRVEPPPSDLPVELARELTATCIHSPTYGTRSATIVAIDRGRTRSVLATEMESGGSTPPLGADGPPCVTPFVDQMKWFS